MPFRYLYCNNALSGGGIKKPFSAFSLSPPLVRKLPFKVQQKQIEQGKEETTERKEKKEGTLSALLHLGKREEACADTIYDFCASARSSPLSNQTERDRPNLSNV